MLTEASAAWWDRLERRNHTRTGVLEALTVPQPPPAYSPAPPPQGPPPGWYTDPHGASGQRWWDGTAWTEHVQA